MNIEEKDVPAAVRSAGKHLFHIQASENDRGTPGTGHVDWSGLVRALRDLEYQGSVVVESFLPTVKEIARAVSLWRPVAPSMTHLARESVSFLRPLLRGAETQSGDVQGSP
jgi:D-psicose/D-tagatose/L-ribulose 3-epimerase